MIEICSVTAGEVYSLYSDCTVGEWWTVQLRYQLHHVNNNNTTEATVFPERNKIKCFVNVDMILLYREIEWSCTGDERFVICYIIIIALYVSVGKLDGDIVRPVCESSRIATFLRAN